MFLPKRLVTCPTSAGPMLWKLLKSTSTTTNTTKPAIASPTNPASIVLSPSFGEDVDVSDHHVTQMQKPRARRAVAFHVDARTEMQHRLERRPVGRRRERPHPHDGVRR